MQIKLSFIPILLSLSTFANEQVLIEKKFNNVQQVFMSDVYSYVLVIDKGDGVFIPESIKCEWRGGKQKKPIIEYHVNNELTQTHVTLKAIKADEFYSFYDTFLELIIYLPDIQQIKGQSKL